MAGVWESPEAEMEEPQPETIVVQRVTYVLPPDLIYRVKDAADAEGLSINFIVETALREFFARREQATKQKVLA
jgi:hypothetical protein